MSRSKKRKFCTYRITCSVTGCVYYGKASDPRARWTQHKYNAACLGNGNGENKLLSTHILEYGVENFSFRVVRWFSTEKQALDHERHLITKYQTNARKHPDGYGLNGNDGGQSGTGYVPTDEDRVRSGIPWRGKKQPDWMVEKRRLANKASPRSRRTKQWKQRTSESVKDWWDSVPEEVLKARSEKLSKATSQYRWYTDGVENIRLHMDSTPPAGYRRGRVVAARSIHRGAL